MAALVILEHENELYHVAPDQILIILPTQCNALIRLCLPPSQKRVKLFYIVFPLPHGGITVRTRQYPYPTTYLLDTFQSVFVI